MRSHQSYQTFCVEQCADNAKKNTFLVYPTPLLGCNNLQQLLFMFQVCTACSIKCLGSFKERETEQTNQ